MIEYSTPHDSSFDLPRNCMMPHKLGLDPLDPPWIPTYPAVVHGALLGVECEGFFRSQTRGDQEAAHHEACPALASLDTEQRRKQRTQGANRTSVGTGTPLAAPPCTLHKE